MNEKQGYFTATSPAANTLAFVSNIVPRSVHLTTFGDYRARNRSITKLYIMEVYNAQ